MFTAAGAVGTIPSVYLGTLVSDILTGAPLLAGTAPFSSDHPSSGMLNGILANARHSMLEMLDKTLTLVSVSEQWIKNIPGVPTTKEEIAQCAAFQKQALISCRMALENSRLANNAFMNFIGCAREEISRLEGEITLLKDRVLSVKAQYNQEIKQARPPQFAVFQTLGLSQPTNGTKIDTLETQRDSEIVKLRNQIIKRTQDLQSGNQFMANSGLWVELCERTSGYLGSIYNILTVIGYGIDIDTVAFKDLMGTQWDQIRKEAEEVKSFLQPSDSATDMMVTPLPQQEPRTQPSFGATSTSHIVHRITYTDDIVGYFDNVSNSKITPLDIINDIREAYLQTAAMHYDSIEQVGTLVISH